MDGGDCGEIVPREEKVVPWSPGGVSRPQSEYLFEREEIEEEVTRTRGKITQETKI